MRNWQDRVDVQSEFEFGLKVPSRAPRPEQLFFALMPEDRDGVALARFAERIIADNDLGLAALKPARLHIAFPRVGAPIPSVLYGAKLAGQAVAAAGLRFCFDRITSLAVPSGRILALTSNDATLALLAAELATALERHGLRPGEGVVPHIALAYGAARLAAQPIAPVPVAVTGLALLRGEAGAKEAQVLRRWPLNKPR